jgi:hypothetical protein
MASTVEALGITLYWNPNGRASRMIAMADRNRGLTFFVISSEELLPRNSRDVIPQAFL